MHISAVMVQHSELSVITAGINAHGENTPACIGLLIGSLFIEL